MALTKFSLCLMLLFLLLNVSLCLMLLFLLLNVSVGPDQQHHALFVATAMADSGFDAYSDDVLGSIVVVDPRSYPSPHEISPHLRPEAPDSGISVMAESGSCSNEIAVRHGRAEAPAVADSVSYSCSSPEIVPHSKPQTSVSGTLIVAGSKVKTHAAVSNSLAVADSGSLSYSRKIGHRSKTHASVYDSVAVVDSGSYSDETGHRGKAQASASDFVDGLDSASFHYSEKTGASHGQKKAYVSASQEMAETTSGKRRSPRISMLLELNGRNYPPPGHNCMGNYPCPPPKTMQDP